jgi:hypothetical protein
MKPNGRLGLGRREHRNDAVGDRAAALAVAAASGLRDLVETRLRAPHPREIEIEPCPIGAARQFLIFLNAGLDRRLTGIAAIAPSLSVHPRSHLAVHRQPGWGATPAAIGQGKASTAV